MKYLGTAVLILIGFVMTVTCVKYRPVIIRNDCADTVTCFTFSVDNSRHPVVNASLAVGQSLTKLVPEDWDGKLWIDYYGSNFAQLYTLVNKLVGRPTVSFYGVAPGTLSSCMTKTFPKE